MQLNFKFYNLFLSCASILMCFRRFEWIRCNPCSAMFCGYVLDKSAGTTYWASLKFPMSFSFGEGRDEANIKTAFLEMPVTRSI